MSEQDVKEQKSDDLQSSAILKQKNDLPAVKGGENAVVASSSKDKAVSSGSVVNFKNKVDIFPDNRLPAYDNGVNRAYKAKGQDRSAMFAIVCEKFMIPRVLAANLYQNIINPSLVSLVDYGKVYWPPAKAERFVFIYNDVLGAPVYSGEGPLALHWKHEEVMSVALKPLVDILQDFHDKDFVHGNIRLSNMFDGGKENGKNKRVVLGDCLSVPPSYYQPALFETIHRAMADPIGRGKGTQADDLYAFGICLACLLRHEDPMYGLSDQEIIKQKILLGSYNAVTGKDRFKGEVLELLRGLLHDDPSQRWTIEDVMVWMDGRRLSPKQSQPPKKAPRPLVFGTSKFLVPSILAMEIEKNPKELRKVVEDETLFLWLERSVCDEEMLDRYTKGLASSGGGGTTPSSGHTERLVANISMALDPPAPIRYKGQHILGDGVGAAMVEAVMLKKPIGNFAELFNNGVLMNWLAIQFTSAFDVVGLHNKFDTCRRYLRSKKIGEGIERCLYLLAPESPCASELLTDYYVGAPEDLLEAFEDLCKKKQAPNNFIDRHIAAFLAQRDSKMIEPYLFDINSAEPYKIVMGNLKCLQALQKKYHPADLPGLSSAVAGMMPAIYKRYHDRETRKKLEKNIQDLAERGNLQKMLAVVGNVEAKTKDFTDFRVAMKEYSSLDLEKNKLEVDLTKKETFGVDTGKEWAAIVSCVVAAIAILVTSISFVM